MFFFSPKLHPYLFSSNSRLNAYRLIRHLWTLGPTLRTAPPPLRLSIGAARTRKKRGRRAATEEAKAEGRTRDDSAHVQGVGVGVGVCA